jgi:hypothetical protein
MIGAKSQIYQSQKCQSDILLVYNFALQPKRNQKINANFFRGADHLIFLLDVESPINNGDLDMNSSAPSESSASSGSGGPGGPGRPLSLIEPDWPRRPKPTIRRTAEPYYRYYPFYRHQHDNPYYQDNRRP